MYSSLFLVLFTGCYLWYTTSRKAKFGKIPPIMQRLAQRPNTAKLTAVVLFVLVWIPLAVYQGLGSGSFALGAYLMATIGTIVLVNPLQYIRWQQCLGLFMGTFLLEVLIF